MGRASQGLAASVPTVAAAVERPVELGILRGMTGRRRDRVFVCGRYLDPLARDTEPLPPP